MHVDAESGHAAHWMYKEGDIVMKSTAPGAESMPLHPLGEDLQSDDEGEAPQGLRSCYARPLYELHSKPSPPKAVRVGHPVLRVEEGRLLAAVIVGYCLLYSTCDYSSLRLSI